jgi:hypothetical protein
VGYLRLVPLLALVLFVPVNPILNSPNIVNKASREARFDALRLQPLNIVPKPQPPAELLTCNKPPCRLPNVQVSAGLKPVNEHSLAVNPKKPKQLFSSGNDYNCMAIQGLYTSNDGGSTWTRSCMPVLPGAVGQGDVSGDYDLNGVLYAAGIEDSQSFIAVVTISRNNGKTWGAPVTLPALNSDKTWLAIDKTPSSRFVNNVYVSLTDFGVSARLIVVSHSADGGKTWKAATVDTVAGNTNDEFTALAIARDGTVFVSWMRCTENSNDDCAGTQASFWISKSTDGGTKWSKPVQIATAMLQPSDIGGFYGTLPNTRERVFDILVLAIDNSSGAHAGTLYAVIYNWTGTFMQVLVTHSVDSGETWSLPVPVSPPGVNHDQFMPWLSVSSTGVLAVTWLDRRNDPANLLYQPFLALSNDGGATFGTNRSLSAKMSNPLDDGFGGTFLGDYRINLWVGKTVYAVWPDTRVGYSQDEIGGMRF